MLRTSKRWHATVALLAASGVFALAGLLASSARADHPTREDLVAHGWTCVEFLPANRWSCFNPGTGRPFPGNPDPRPTYNFLAFDRTSGEFIYTGHLIRQDLYSGQPCAPGDDPYDFRAAIGYYECIHA
jgi:hypothetical protein